MLLDQLTAVKKNSRTLSSLVQIRCKEQPINFFAAYFTVMLLLGTLTAELSSLLQILFVANIPQSIQIECCLNLENSC